MDDTPLPPPPPPPPPLLSAPMNLRPFEVVEAGETGDAVCNGAGVVDVAFPIVPAVTPTLDAVAPPSLADTTEDPGAGP